jgi:predicted RNase H-like HicB family nuclease
MSVFNYKYEAVWSQKDGAFIARVEEFPSIAAHGASRASSLRALRSVVDAVVKNLIESGQEIPAPASAKKKDKK